MNSSAKISDIISIIVSGKLSLRVISFTGSFFSHLSVCLCVDRCTYVCWREVHIRGYVCIHVSVYELAVFPVQGFAMKELER